MPLDAFHPGVRDWFRETFGEPSPPQARGWPAIRQGGHTLIAAPTGTGKTLAAFLWAVDSLLREGDALGDETRILYVSPLRALANDVRRNLEDPLHALRRRIPEGPGIRVQVRSGDTPAREREAMRRRPPHILVTTPESLAILLTSDGGRAQLATVRTVIVDEIHAVVGSKRGAHLALSLERLDHLCGGRLQRIGLSATQKPVEDIARWLAGVGREATVVDVGHRRRLDLDIEVPDVPLATVCSHETWDDIARRMAELIREHRTTLVFANTRKLAERIAARLAPRLGPDAVTSHHGSLSRARRLEAEQRLKEGRLRALVATASLELGIDVGDVDLVIQAGVPSSIAGFLQRVGRSGHDLRRVPKGRIFPLTQDELVAAAALMDAVRRGELDRTPQPRRPLDILAQHVVAACVSETWDEDALYARLRRAWPYRDLSREDFDAVVALHAEGRRALLHRDGVRRRFRATRRARIPALTSGGAIPDRGEYQVVLEPHGERIGSLDEDFAVEANVGDIFQLGNASWRILKVEPGIVRVADAAGAPPSLPFWFGEAPARTQELSAAVARVRVDGRDPRWLQNTLGLSPAAAVQLADYLDEGARTLGAVPTPTCVVLERFFDESGGMQLVLHAPFGGRINRAWGLALRKRFCRGFGFELQAAANEEAVVLSLGPQHSFPLEEVFDYLHPDTVRDVLVQAVLPTPVFATRWRWNATLSLKLPRMRGGRRVPTPLLRMRAEDLLVQAFPQVLACGETLPPGDLPVPWEHPLVRQTLEDCLEEAMDAAGLKAVLRGIRDGSIRTVAVDTPAPSAFARGILNAQPYAFLDDAPLEERRTQAVQARRHLSPEIADTLGALDPRAVEQVRSEAWPDPRDAEELHEALLWIGYLRQDEVRRSGWEAWVEALAAEGRVEIAHGRVRAVDGLDDPKQVLAGRLEALGPVRAGDVEAPAPGADPERLLVELEAEGRVLRCRWEGGEAWCDRRLLARIHRRTLEGLRREIEPVTAAAFRRFLGAWQHAAPGFRLGGPRGTASVLRKLSGFEAPAPAWEASLLRARVDDYRPDWLDTVTLNGEMVWLRLWGSGAPALRSTPLTFVPREELDGWLRLAALRRAAGALREPSGHARRVRSVLERRGPSFEAELRHHAGLLDEHLDLGMAELVARGELTCDSFAGLRRLLAPRLRRRRARERGAPPPAGRWWLLPATEASGEPPDAWDPDDPRVALAAGRLLERYGVVFRALVQRERMPLPWRCLVRRYRLEELRGHVRGGRFVQRFPGEQFALSAAVEQMRRLRRRGLPDAPETPSADPLHLDGVLDPARRPAPAPAPAAPRR